jgi:low affinity Fe/Cu permease
MFRRFLRRFPDFFGVPWWLVIMTVLIGILVYSL